MTFQDMDAPPLRHRARGRLVGRRLDPGSLPREGAEGRRAAQDLADRTRRAKPSGSPDHRRPGSARVQGGGRMTRTHHRSILVGTALATMALTLTSLGVVRPGREPSGQWGPAAAAAGVPAVPTGYAELDQALGADKPFTGTPRHDADPVDRRRRRQLRCGRRAASRRRRASTSRSPRCHPASTRPSSTSP